jgi:hypothetical protein
MINQCFWWFKFHYIHFKFYTCFHNILKTLSSKCIETICNIINVLTRKHEKKTLVIVPMAPIFMNVPPFRKLFIIHVRVKQISIQQKMNNIGTFENKAQI